MRSAAIRTSLHFLPGAGSAQNLTFYLFVETNLSTVFVVTAHMQPQPVDFTSTGIKLSM